MCCCFPQFPLLGHSRSYTQHTKTHTHTHTHTKCGFLCVRQSYCWYDLGVSRWSVFPFIYLQLIERVITFSRISADVCAPRQQPIHPSVGSRCAFLVSCIDCIDMLVLFCLCSCVYICGRHDSQFSAAPYTKT